MGPNISYHVYTQLDDGQRCFKLLALISSSQHIQTDSILQPPLGQTERTLMTCTVAERILGIIDFSLVVLRNRTSEKPTGSYKGQPRAILYTKAPSLRDHENQNGKSLTSFVLDSRGL